MKLTYSPQHSRQIRTALRMMAVSWHVRPMATLGYYVGALGETLSYLGSMYATAKLAGLLAQYLSGSTDTSAIWFWLWVDIAAAAGVAISFWIMSWCKRLIYFRIVQWAANRFHATLSRLAIADFYDEDTRNQLNKVQDGYNWQISNFNEATMDLVYGIIRFVATAIVVSQITWWLIPLVALFLVPTLLAEAKLAKIQWYIWGEKGDDRHIFWGLQLLVRNAKNQMELRSSQASDYVQQRMDTINHAFYSKQEQKFRSLNKLMLPSKILEIAGTAIGSIVLLRQFLHGSIALDRYFFLSAALLRVGGALNNIFGTLARMQESSLFAADFFALTDRKATLTDKPNAIAISTKRAPKVTFEHVAFAYPGHSEAVFDDLNFAIEPGQHVAIVGENGAGKSTLIKLLLRFYVPTSGRILIDGVDLQDIAIESWYNQLASLFQEFNQYPFSIAENIEVARPEHAGDPARLQAAAKFANIDKMAESYKYGWETVLDNSFKKGVEPSGGQWQRVALARAFYRQANVLILDEPTAAIDAKAEYDIFNNIFKHYKSKTAIIVSHRFSTVRRADTIIVVDKGKIVEQGSHEALMKQKGLYHELFSKQAEGYK